MPQTPPIDRHLSDLWLASRREMLRNMLIRRGGVAGPAADRFPVDSTGWADLSTELGLGAGTPTEIWDYADLNTAAVGELAATSKAAVATPTFRVVPAVYTDQYGIQLDGDTNDRLQAGTGALDIGTNSFVFEYVVEQGVVPASTVTMAEKFAGGLGWSFSQFTSGFMELKIQSAAGSDTATLSANHAGGPRLYWFGRNVTSGNYFAYSNLSSATGTLTATGTITNTGNLRDGRFLSPYILFVHCTLWIGAAAEWVTAAKFAARQANLGL